jgi:catechol 2,3-dioxygenase-like lactoylglutathione lyase family enzyme
MLSDFTFGTRIRISDYERARAFYVETLGLQPRAELAGHAVSFQTGDGGVFAIYVEGDFARPVGAWIVDDVEAEVRELQNRGVEFREVNLPSYKSSNGVIRDRETGRPFAYFTDPDGNELGIFAKSGH